MGRRGEVKGLLLARRVVGAVGELLGPPGVVQRVGQPSTLEGQGAQQEPGGYLAVRIGNLLA